MNALKHIKLLIRSIMAVTIGVLLWIVIGPVISSAGVGGHYEGFWPFGRDVTDLSVTYWVGVAASVVGICVFAFGIVGILLSVLLEFLEKERIAQSNRTAETQKPA